MENRLDSRQILLHLTLIPTVVGAVIFTTDQFVGHILLRRDGSRIIVGVLVALVIAPAFHEFRRGIAQIQRNLADMPSIDVGERLVDCIVAGVGFRCGGHGDSRFGEDDARFGHADHGDRLRGGDRDLEDLRRGHTDFLGSRDHDTPGDKSRILTRPEHLGEIVDGRIRVRASHGFDERGDDIVMVVAVLVVTHGRHVHDTADNVRGDDRGLV